MMSWFKYLKRPPEHQEDTKAFWDDPHISQYMLDAHLNDDFDAASRHPDFMDQTLTWIKGVYPPTTHPAVLDLGCGPGLYAKRFADAGYSVTGIDVSKRSIEHALTYAPNACFRAESFFDLADVARYDIATIFYCEFGVFSPAQRTKLIKNVYRALKPGSVLILDVFTPNQFKARQEQKSWAYESEGGFFSPKPHLILSAFYRYPNHLFLEQFVIVETDQVDAIYNWHQTFTKSTLGYELKKSGFRVEGVYRDLTGKPYDEAHETVAMIARKP